jgi:hypothetical protein
MKANTIAWRKQHAITLQYLRRKRTLNLEPPIETPIGERTEVPTPLVLRFVEASPQQDAQHQPLWVQDSLGCLG